MFENQIKAAKTELLEHVHTGRQFEYLRDLCADENVHPFYAGFFTAEVEWWLLERRMLHLANPRFNYESPEFSGLFDAMDEVSRRQARFDAHDLKSILDLAVKTRINYLLRPRTTLKWFVFRGEPTKPLHEVLLRLNYFSAYTYLIDGFKRWAEARSADKNGSDLLSVVEFERALETIDNDEILDYSTTEFADLLDPIFEFFAEVDEDTAGKGIPTPALIVFLDDKGVFRISQELEKRIRSEHLSFIRKADFLRVIEDVLHEMEEDPDAERPGGETDLSRSFDAESALGSNDFSPHAAEAGSDAVDDDDVDKYVISASFPGDDPRRSDDDETVAAAADDDEAAGDDDTPPQAEQASPEQDQSVIYKIELVAPETALDDDPAEVIPELVDDEAEAAEASLPVEVLPAVADDASQMDTNEFDAADGELQQADAENAETEHAETEHIESPPDDAGDQMHGEQETDLNTEMLSAPEAESASEAEPIVDEEFPLHDPAFDAPRHADSAYDELSATLQSSPADKPEGASDLDSAVEDISEMLEDDAADATTDDSFADRQLEDLSLEDKEDFSPEDSADFDAEVNKNVMGAEPAQESTADVETQLNSVENDAPAIVYSGADERENSASLQPHYSDDSERIDFSANAEDHQSLGWLPGAREDFQHAFQDSDPADTFSAKPILLTDETEAAQPESPSQVVDLEGDAADEQAPNEELPADAQPVSEANSEVESYGSTEVEFKPEFQDDEGPELNTEPEAGLNSESETDLNAAAESELNAEPEVEFSAEPDLEFNVEPEAELNTEPEVELNTELVSESEADIEEPDNEAANEDIVPADLDTQVEQPGIPPEAAEEIAADRLGETQADEPAGSEAAPAPDAMVFAIESGLRTKIIRKVFGGNEGALDEALALLAGEKHWKAALNRVDLILAEQDVNPMSPAAAAFREVVINRFAAE